jgi:HlyD family secretion protein
MKKLPFLLLLGVTGTPALADEGKEAGPRPPFRTQAVKRGSVAQTVRATGTLEPEEVMDVGAQVAGQIEKFGSDPDKPDRPIDFGSRVAEGTVLVQLDAARYKVRRDQAQARVASAEAVLKLAEAQLRLAERERDKVRKRLGERTASQDDLDEAAARCEVAQGQVAVAQAGVEEARAALKEAETNLGYTTIRSPVKGVVVDRRVNVGQVVTASLNAPSLFLIARDLKHLQVWASVPEADIGAVQVGQPARFTVDAYPNRAFSGKVGNVRLNAAMNRGVVTYTVVIDTDNADGKLLPYLTADVSITADEHKNVLVVPNAALRWMPQEEQVAPDAREALRRPAPEKGEAGHTTGVVWVEDKTGHVRPVRLRLGLSDGAVTEVVEGDLTEGQAVVTGGAASGSRQGLLRIRPGTSVETPTGSLTAADADALARTCPAVTAAVPVVRLRATLRDEGHSYVPLYLYGVTPAFLKVRGATDLEAGRAFTEEEVRGRRKVCLVGRTVVRELFGGGTAVAKRVRIGDVPFEVVGVLGRQPTDVLTGLDQDDIVLAPWTAFKDVQAARAPADGPPKSQPQVLADLYPTPTTGGAGGEPDDKVSEILVQTTPAEEIAETRRQVTEVLRERHHIRPGRADDFVFREIPGPAQSLSSPSR